MNLGIEKETSLKKRIAEIEDSRRTLQGELNDVEKTNKDYRQKLGEEEFRSSAGESRIAFLRWQVAGLRRVLKEQLRQQNRSEEDIFEEASWSCEVDEASLRSFTSHSPLSETESGMTPSLTLRAELGDLYESDCSATEAETSDTHSLIEQCVRTEPLIEQGVKPLIVLSDERRLLATSTDEEDVWSALELTRETSKE